MGLPSRYGRGGSPQWKAIPAVPVIAMDTGAKRPAYSAVSYRYRLWLTSFSMRQRLHKCVKAMLVSNESLHWVFGPKLCDTHTTCARGLRPLRYVDKYRSRLLDDLHMRRTTLTAPTYSSSLGVRMSAVATIIQCFSPVLTLRAWKPFANLFRYRPEGL